MTREQWSVKVELFAGHCALQVSEFAQFRKSISEVLPLVKDIPVRALLHTCHLVAADAFKLGCFHVDVYTVGEDRKQKTEYGRQNEKKITALTSEFCVPLIWHVMETMGF